MARVSRKGDTCSGHGDFPSRASTVGSPNVFINGLPALRQGDSFASHTDGETTHSGVAGSGSPNVFVNGKPLMRVGDNVSCGSRISTGSANVFAN